MDDVLLATDTYPEPDPDEPVLPDELPIDVKNGVPEDDTVEAPE